MQDRANYEFKVWYVEDGVLCDGFYDTQEEAYEYCKWLVEEGHTEKATIERDEYDMGMYIPVEIVTKERL